MTRAIIYTRVSSDEQKKNNSPSAQQTDGTAYAQAHGMTLLDVLNEDYTGTMIDRPVFTRLLELADEGLVDAVIVQHPDRLGRGPILELAIALLAKRGVEVHATNRGIISDEDDENAQIQNSVDGLVSGIERRNIRRRTIRGRLEKVTVKRQLPGHGAAPYGYCWQGVRRERVLVIRDEEATIVRLIFEWYVSGVSVAEISARLEAMSIPSPCFSNDNHRTKKRENIYHWRRTMIHRILKRRTYVGEFVAFGGKKQKRAKKQISTDPVVIPVPAIVSRDLFDEAQAQLAVGRQRSQRNNRRYFYLLRCLLRCPCGTGMTGHTQGKYYRCSAAMRPHDFTVSCTNRTCYHVQDVDYTVWTWIDENVLIEENLREGLARKAAQTADERGRLHEQRAYYAERLADVDGKIERLKLLYTNGVFKLEEIAPDKKRLDTSRAEFEQHLSDIEEKIAALDIFRSAAQQVIEKVRQIKAKVACLTDAGKREILELLDTQITLYLKDGAPWCHIAMNITVQEKDIPIVSQDSKRESGVNRPED
jgi:site-specific DNA recombinase